MSFKQSFKEVMSEAKKAFEDIERTQYEKHTVNKKKTTPCLKSVGFVNGTKSILVYK